MLRLRTHPNVLNILMLSEEETEFTFLQTATFKICFAQWCSATFATFNIPTKQLSTWINDETIKISKNHTVSPFLALFFLGGGGAFCWCEEQQDSQQKTAVSESHGEVWRTRRDLCFSAHRGKMSSTPPHTQHNTTMFSRQDIFISKLSNL